MRSPIDSFQLGNCTTGKCDNYALCFDYRWPHVSLYLLPVYAEVLMWHFQSTKIDFAQKQHIIDSNSGILPSI